MSTDMLKYMIIAVGAIFAVIVVAYLILNKKMQKSDYQQIKKLRRGTESSKFSFEVLYQKLYISYSKMPFIKSYILKLRRRLEILNVDDEYATRRDSAKILTIVLLIMIPIVTASIIFAHTNYLTLSIILIFEIFMVDNIVDNMVEKMYNNLLKEKL